MQLMSSLLLLSLSSTQLEHNEEANRKVSQFLLLEPHKGHSCRIGAQVSPSRVIDINV